MACTIGADAAPNPSRGMRLVRRKRKARLLVAEAMAALDKAGALSEESGHDPSEKLSYPSRANFWRRKAARDKAAAGDKAAAKKQRKKSAAGDEDIPGPVIGFLMKKGVIKRKRGK